MQTSLSLYLVPTFKVIAFSICLTHPQITCISNKSLKVTRNLYLHCHCKALIFPINSKGPSKLK